MRFPADLVAPDQMSAAFKDLGGKSTVEAHVRERTLEDHGTNAPRHRELDKRQGGGLARAAAAGPPFKEGSAECGAGTAIPTECVHELAEKFMRARQKLAPASPRRDVPATAPADDKLTASQRLAAAALAAASAAAELERGRGHQSATRFVGSAPSKVLEHISPLRQKHIPTSMAVADAVATAAAIRLACAPGLAEAPHPIQAGSPGRGLRRHTLSSLQRCIANDTCTGGSALEAPAAENRRGAGLAVKAGISSSTRDARSRSPGPTTPARSLSRQLSATIAPQTQRRSTLLRSQSPSRPELDAPAPYLGPPRFSPRAKLQSAASNRSPPYYSWELAYDSVCRGRQPSASFGRDKTSRSGPLQWSRSPTPGRTDGPASRCIVGASLCPSDASPCPGARSSEGPGGPVRRGLSPHGSCAALTPVLGERGAAERVPRPIPVSAKRLSRIGRVDGACRNAGKPTGSPVQMQAASQSTDCKDGIQAEPARRSSTMRQRTVSPIGGHRNELIVRSQSPLGERHSRAGSRSSAMSRPLRTCR